MKQGWEYKKLGEVFQTSSGGTPSKSHLEYYEGGTIPWLRSGEVSQGYIYDAEIYITQEAINHSSAKVFPSDTVVIAMYGATVGQVGILKRSMCTNQAICGILPNNSYSTDFLRYTLSAQKKNYLKLAVGGAQPNISQQIVKDTLIPYIDLTTQQSIVSELDTLSQIIADYKEQLADYDKMEQSIFYDMFGDPVKNEKGWEVKKLSEVTSLITDGVHAKPNYVEKGIPFVSVKNITTGSLIMEDLKYVSLDDHVKYKKRCPVGYGDILYSKVGATYGRAALVETNEEFSLYVSVALIKPLSDVVNNVFLLKQLMTDFVKHQADISIKGIGVPDLHLNMIKGFDIILPPLPLQQQFASKIESIEQMKADSKAALQDAELLFNARMDYWFNA